MMHDISGSIFQPDLDRTPPFVVCVSEGNAYYLLYARSFPNLVFHGGRIGTQLHVAIVTDSIGKPFTVFSFPSPSTHPHVLWNGGDLPPHSGCRNQPLSTIVDGGPKGMEPC